MEHMYLLIEKNSTCKWTLPVHTCIVQGSTILSVALLVKKYIIDFSIELEQVAVSIRLFRFSGVLSLWGLMTMQIQMVVAGAGE